MAEGESTREIVVKYVLRNRAIWALAFSYFFLYIVRQGMTTWGQFFIVDQKGVAMAQAAATLSALEIGGFFGGLCSGVLSDACDGFRMRVVVLYSTPYSDEKVANRNLRVWRQKNGLERRTNPKLSRRACTCEYGLHAVEGNRRA